MLLKYHQNYLETSSDIFSYIKKKCSCNYNFSININFQCNLNIHIAHKNGADAHQIFVSDEKKVRLMKTRSALVISLDVEHRLNSRVGPTKNWLISNDTDHCIRNPCTAYTHTGTALLREEPTHAVVYHIEWAILWDVLCVYYCAYGIWWRNRTKKAGY